MKKQTAYRTKAIAAKMDRQERAMKYAFALLVTGFLIGQLLLLTSP